MLLVRPRAFRVRRGLCEIRRGHIHALPTRSSSTSRSSRSSADYGVQDYGLVRIAGCARMGGGCGLRDYGLFGGPLNLAALQGLAPVPPTTGRWKKGLSAERRASPPHTKAEVKKEALVLNVQCPNILRSRPQIFKTQAPKLENPKGIRHILI